MQDDPRAIIDREPMSAFQWKVVAVVIGLFAIDGFDILAISFASPGISTAWGIDRAQLGFVLSVELLGMSIGSLGLGGFADRWGRRATIVLCLVLISVGMFGAATADGVVTLCAWRIVSGIGIGGMLATISTLIAETTNIARRDLCIMLGAMGYPIGATIGGTICAELLKHFDWPVIFIFGGVATFAFLPLVLFYVPETIAFQITRQRSDSLEKINKTLARMNHRRIDALPPSPPPITGLPLARLFTPALRPVTLLMLTAYFAHIMTFYFLIKWVPKIVADLGYSVSDAAEVLVATNIGGALGCLALSLLSLRLPVRQLTMGALLLAAMLVAFFGQTESWTLGGLSLVAMVAGCGTNAGVVGIYTLMARFFPPEVRASATGFVIGVGRGGSIIGPIVAGLLFKAGYGLPLVALFMSSGSFIAAITLIGLRKHKMTY